MKIVSRERVTHTVDYVEVRDVPIMSTDRCVIQPERVQVHRTSSDDGPIREVVVSGRTVGDSGEWESLYYYGADIDGIPDWARELIEAPADPAAEAGLPQGVTLTHVEFNLTHVTETVIDTDSGMEFYPDNLRVAVHVDGETHMLASGPRRGVHGRGSESWLYGRGGWIADTPPAWLLNLADTLTRAIGWTEPRTKA